MGTEYNINTTFCFHGNRQEQYNPVNDRVPDGCCVGGACYDVYLAILSCKHWYGRHLPITIWIFQMFKLNKTIKKVYNV